ncbi:MAG: hypothetical protein AAFN93_19590 [Bacteroidota bacterium]
MGKEIEERDGVFFITFSCYNWISLFDITNSYDIVYNWFDILIEKGHQITGYVIMPNHIHALIALKNSSQKINTIVANAKRFMAYELIQRLKNQGHTDVLSVLSKAVTAKERSKGQSHRVFNGSFDVKVCFTHKFVEQKLDYIHNNPCSGKWRLVENPIDYVHSSMRFYAEYHPAINSKLTPYTALFEG